MDRVAQMERVLEKRLAGVRRSIVKNLAVLTDAILKLCAGGRSGQGRLSLSAIARKMEVKPKKKAGGEKGHKKKKKSPGSSLKVKFKRLSRFLMNRWFTPEVMTPELVRLTLGERGPSLVPVLVDQTTMAGVQVLMAGTLFSGRVLPVAFTCFTYDEIRHSQNKIETGLIALIQAWFPSGSAPVYIGDRAYGRSQLLEALQEMAALHVLRCKGRVMVVHRGKLMMLNRLSYRVGVPTRYRGLLYHAKKRLPVDVVIYRGHGFQDTWYVLVPAGSEKVLPTEEVVELYRSRMQIEQGFRDWKTHLGIRGLKLQKDQAVRLGRLLMGFALAYMLVTVLGATQWAQGWRPRFETLRTNPRHGTRRTLSALKLGSLLLGEWDLVAQALRELARLLHRVARGDGLAFVMKAA